MKINKFIMTAALSFGLSGLANAGTIYITGSTALRDTVFATMIAPGAVFTLAPTTTTYQGAASAQNKSDWMAFSGTLVGGSGPTLIKCHWSGSEGGIKDVVTGTAETHIADSLLDGANHTGDPATTESHASDLAFADNSQAFSRNKTPALTTGNNVAIITFKWMRNPGLWTGSNVTEEQVRQALKGFCKRSLFTGVAGQNDYVYVSGRNNLSGTRVNEFGISGFGIFTIPNQIEITSAGDMIDLDGGGTYAGDFGYDSGSDLAATMGANTTAKTDFWNGGTGFSVIAFASVGDTATAVANGATELTYNGVAFSPTAIKEGQYVCWGNAYVYQKNGLTGGSEPVIAYNNIINTATGLPFRLDGTKAIKLSDMNATRPGPTSEPVHN